MAKQDVRTNEQNQATQGQSVTRSQQSQGRSLTRGYDPFGLNLLPGDFFRSPFSLFRRMSEEMDRIFGDYTASRGDSGRTWSPAIEVQQKEGSYVVRAELPGLKPEDVKIEVTDDSLIVQGERKEEHEETRSGVHMTERRYGQFYRAIPLPEGANLEQAKARFNNGVLEVTVPVQEAQTSRRQIPIEGATAGTSGGSGSSGGAGRTA